MTRPFRHTKIIFTVGPATEQVERLRELIREGVDVCRINMAHADHEWTRSIVRRIREASQAESREICILMDIKGPEIRTGRSIDQPLSAGDLVEFWVTEPPEQTPCPATTVNYPRIHEDLSAGDTILVDNGLLRFEVVESTDDFIRCKTLIGGKMGSRRHINLPGVHVQLPCLTDKDKGDLEVGVEAGVDYFALSFVRTAEDVHTLRNLLSSKESRARIIAKIEDQQGIQNLDAIIKASDGLMFARGDLGIECPYEELPVLQSRVVDSCIQKIKPAIVATHMLESMTEHPLPTRAEVSDVAWAVRQQSDCLMLSGETTVGKYPLECVKVLQKVATRIESDREGAKLSKLELSNPRAKLARSAATLASELEGGCLVVFTRSGYLARLLSSLRPTRTPIFAFTDQPELFRQLILLWGVEPFLMEFPAEREGTITNALNRLLEQGWANHGDLAVILTNFIRQKKIIDSVQIRRIEPQQT